MWEGKIDKMTFYGAKKLKIWLHCYGYSYEQILPTAR